MRPPYHSQHCSGGTDWSKKNDGYFGYFSLYGKYVGKIKSCHYGYFCNNLNYILYSQCDSENIRCIYYRRIYHLSQKELGDQIGVQKNTIFRFEKGEKISKLKRIKILKKIEKFAEK